MLQFETCLRALGGSRFGLALEKSAILSFYDPWSPVFCALSRLSVVCNHNSFRHPAWIRTTSGPCSRNDHPLRGNEQPCVSCNRRRSSEGSEPNYRLEYQDSTEEIHPLEGGHSRVHPEADGRRKRSERAVCICPECRSVWIDSKG